MREAFEPMRQRFVVRANSIPDVKTIDAEKDPRPRNADSTPQGLPADDLKGLQGEEIHSHCVERRPRRL